MGQAEKRTTRARRRATPADKSPVVMLRPSHGTVNQLATASSMRANRQALLDTVDVEKSLGFSTGATPDPSQVSGEDPFASFASQGITIEPPFDMLALTTLPERNSELMQTIEAMETNIEATGHRFVPRVDVLAAGIEQEMIDSVKHEHVKLQNFFQYCTAESFIEFRMKLRKDKETTGNCYLEVIRDSANNISGFTHMPAYQVRLGRMEDEPVLVDRPVLELQVDGSVVVKSIKQWRRFRKFVQSRHVSSTGFSQTVQGVKARWFKEYGDQRSYSAKTGNELTPEQLAKSTPADLANEVIHLKLYSARSPYGMPRFIGNLLSIYGDRASEEINYVTFRNNNIPSMAVMVSNGQLTQGTIDRISAFVESQIQKSDNYSKFLIIEGEPIEDDGEDGGQMKIEIKPLTDAQHKDALFQNYSKNNQDKIRRAFRLPPIFVGLSSDYTRSTAEASRRLADEQIFAPERTIWDELLNRHLFPDMGVVYHKYKTNTPNTTDNEQLVRILAGAEKTGGMTPRIARMLLEDILGSSLPGFKPYADGDNKDNPDAFDPDVPFSLTMARAVKNEADVTEPGQQVTALKALGILEPTVDDSEIVATAKQLVTLSAKVDELWSNKDV